MFDLKLYSSNIIEIELASCVGYIGYISANIMTKKEKEKKEMERKKRKGKGKGKGKGIVAGGKSVGVISFL